MFKFIDRLSNFWGWIIFFILFVSMSWMFAVSHLPVSVYSFSQLSNGIKLIDSTINYSPEQVYEMIENYGQRARDYYLNSYLPVDYIYAVIYTLFFCITWNLILKNLIKDQSLMQKLLVLPLLGGIFDILENTGSMMMLLSFPRKLSAVAGINNDFTLLKLFLFTVSSLFMIVGGIIMIVKFVPSIVKKSEKR